MAARLCFLCCENFATEASAAVAAEGWTDVSVAAFPSRCGRPPLAWDELRSLLPSDCTDVVIFGRACQHGLGVAPDDFPPARVLSVQQCFHLVASEALVNEEISRGGYLVTPSWLADWRTRIEALGFTVDNVGEFFHEFAREVVLLDTGVRADTQGRLAELEASIRLPVRVIPVGLEVFRHRLARCVLEWRLAESDRAAKAQAKRHARELADHVAAMDMLVRLARTQNEADAIAAIEDLFRMLFAPGELYYVRVERNVMQAPADLPEAIGDQLAALRDEHAPTPDGRGFVLRIARDGDTLGLVVVERLAFPEYRERYLNTALAVTGVCALAIENARNRKRLLEAEKMESLGILVAGVAHEIGTPLGVCLAASTALQSQSHRLGERFGARTLTQGDLAAYLDKAEASAALLCGNLERIGRLVEAFRLVAVQDRVASRRPFQLGACIDDAIVSFGDRPAAQGIEFMVECAPDVVIEGNGEDWASIFLNLIGNSLKYGFCGRDHGVIQIRANCSAGMMRIDYLDDGNGMSAETLASIFDPFYTTDLQHGMGLGMHLVYNLVVHRMAGSIVCDSAPGRGVHFSIEIPV